MSGYGYAGANLLGTNYGFYANVSPGGKARAAISWQITGTQNHTYVLVSCYGTYDAGTGTFQPVINPTSASVSGFSQSRVDNIDTTIPTSGMPAGTYDGFVFIADSFDPATGTITNMYDYQVTTGAITVGGGGGGAAGASITSVNYSAV